MSLHDEVTAAANRLAKWRTVFAGWQLGTRPKSDPEAAAVRDHREVTMMMRAELNALIALVCGRLGVREEEFLRVLLIEIRALDAAYEEKFPGFQATDEGMQIDTKLAAETMRGWKP